MSEVLDAVRTGWSWTGIEADEVLAVSPFGHLIVRDKRASYWHLDPEMRTLTLVASDREGLLAYMAEPEVRTVWQARALVDAAQARLGDPGEGQCYSLKPLALLEGDYSHENLIIISAAELIRFTGDVERQIHALPNGARFQLKVVD